MFASEKLVEEQKDTLRVSLRDDRFTSRSVSALAKLINESEYVTVDLLNAIGAEAHHTGCRSGKSYYRLPA